MNDDTPASAGSEKFNRASRVPLEAVVRLHFENEVSYQNGFSANISATGMFVKHPEPHPIHTKLVFEFLVGHGRQPVQGSGNVVWVRPTYEGPGRPAGMGIEYERLDAKSREHLVEALFEHLEESLGSTPLFAAEAGEPAGAEPQATEPPTATAPSTAVEVRPGPSTPTSALWEPAPANTAAAPPEPRPTGEATPSLAQEAEEISATDWRPERDALPPPSIHDRGAPSR